MAVRVLETRCGGFVDHRQDVPAGAAERLQGEEALGGPRVRGDADEGLEGLIGGHSCHGRVRAQLAGDVAEETSERIKDRDAVVAQAQRGGVGHRGVGQKALEGTQVRRALARGVLSVEAEHEAIAVEGEHRGDEVDRVLTVVDEGDDGIVSSINNSDRGRGGAKIYSKSHDPNTSAHCRRILGRLAGASHVFQ